MRVLHVCSELYPLLKTGGLADVTGALPAALAKLGCDGRVLVPGFPAFMEHVIDKQLITILPPGFGVDNINLYYGSIPNSHIGIYIIDAKGLYDRPGNPYEDKAGNSYHDNYRRFALLGYVSMRLAEGLDSHWRPQVVHGHDWHAGLSMAYLKAHEVATGHRLAGTVFTIHNLAFQGIFPAKIFPELGLPAQFFNINGLEFYGQVSFLKAGLFFADKLTTVSPTYASEIQEDTHGCGFQGLLQNRKYDLRGILNGIDIDIWNPAKDVIIDNKYTIRSMAGKLKCKTTLQEKTGLKVQNLAPIFAVVSRLTEQKGLHFVLAGILPILKRGGQIVLLGSGNLQLEAAFKSLAKKYPESVSVKIGYDEQFAHLIIAGSDVIMVPSGFEPCGLTQLYGMIYGTLPLVHKVGGLADTVVDCSLENLDDGNASGFVFENFSQNAFDAAVKRAFALYNRKTDWKRVQKYAMGQDFSWSKSSEQFIQLYKQIAT